MKLLKEPLLHFLLAGFLLFVFFEIVSDDDAALDPRVITVDRANLLTFLQFRSRAFEPEMAAEQLDAMSAEQLEDLINAYVQEEALYREAVALGMDKNDYIIKQRMIQSIRFISDGFVSAAVDVSEDDARAFFETNADDFYIDPTITFTHVFFRSDGGDMDAVRQRAAAKLDELNASGAGFPDAPGHGDLFPYSRNYVERTPVYVASHFGTPMSESLFALEPDAGQWQGPFESAYGMHVVLLVERSDGGIPAFEEVRDVAEAQARRAAIQARQQEAIQTIVDTYETRRMLGDEATGQP